MSHGVVISATPPAALRDKGMRRMLATAPSHHLDGVAMMKRFVLIFGDDLAQAFAQRGIAQLPKPTSEATTQEKPHA